MNEKENIYFIGIGGIGMSALARYFNQKGKNVAGYDRSITQLTKRIQSEGIAVNYLTEEDTIPIEYRNTENTLVVYTPAVSMQNPILKYFLTNGFECLKRAEVLGQLSKNFKTIAVAGTHGKTTVSSMIAYLLKQGGLKINAFLGGISLDFGTNLLLDEGAEIMVTEADEYDRSFLQLNPDQLVITSIDADHLDIYSNHEALIQTYKQLLSQLQKNGSLLAKPSVLKALEVSKEIFSESFSIEEEANITAANIRVENGEFVFDYHSPSCTIERVVCGLPGIHNVENAVAAISIALKHGLDPKEVKQSIGSFKGVKRRFDVHLKTDEIVYIDDYAHHPEELRMLLSSVRELYPKKKITAVFQPHLYSRTRDFGDEFASVLSTADDLILLDLYPAREEPIEGIDSNWLAKKTGKKNVSVCAKNQLINLLKSKEVELLLTIGAGDVDTLVEPIINHYESETL